MSYIKGWDFPIKPIVGSYTTAQANVTLWTPSTGRKIQLWTVIASTLVAGEIFITRSSDNSLIIPKLQLDNKGGAVIGSFIPIYELNVDEVIKVTTNITGQHGISLVGFEL